MALRLAPTSRLASSAVKQRAPSGLAVPVRVAGAAPRPGVRARATNEGQQSSTATDVDAIIQDLTKRFEASEQKPAIIGYTAAAIGAFFFSEWLIHLPGLDILLGFPVQLVGLLVLPFLVLRWGVDKKDVIADVGDVVTSVTKKLPGLDGKN